MKTLNITSIKPAFTGFLLLISAFVANAQSLPGKQETSLRAPANLKIDGKATEWDNQFQAYNKATELFYTVSNDDDNLYFTIQAKQPRVIEKIMNVGVTVAINSAGEKKDNAPENVSVNFPLMDFAYVPKIVFDAGDQTEPPKVGPMGRQIGGYKPEFEIKPSDSLKDVATKSLVTNAKTIQIKGVKEIPDGQLSVYNEEGIKVAAAFDHTGVYTYELAVPLKYLHLSINDSKKFSYNIKLQSRLDVLRHGMVTRYVIRPGVGQVDQDQDLDSTTDFWGEYTLAKK